MSGGCPQCGEISASHYVPPYLGESGFFLCDSTHEPGPAHGAGAGHAQAGRPAGGTAATGRPSYDVKIAIKRTLGWSALMAEKQARYGQLMEGAEDLDQHARDQLHQSAVGQLRLEGY